MQLLHLDLICGDLGAALRATIPGERALSVKSFVRNARVSIMSTHMPPIPPANRNRNSPGSNPEKDTSKDKSVTHEHHANAAEKGETANIKQNTTNKGFFRGRRFG